MFSAKTEVYHGFFAALGAGWQPYLKVSPQGVSSKRFVYRISWLPRSVAVHWYKQMQLMRMTWKPPGVKMIILEMIAESMRAYAGGGDYGLLQDPS